MKIDLNLSGLNSEGDIMKIDLNQSGLNPENPSDKDFMKRIQGNILRSHGYRLITCLFGKLLPQKNQMDANKFATFVGRRISSELNVHDRRSKTIRNQDSDNNQRCFVGCYVSRRGYQNLGWDIHEDQFFTPMVQAKNSLNDDVSQFSRFWTAGEQKLNQIDFMIMIAHDHSDKIDTEVQEIQADLERERLATIAGSIPGKQSPSKAESQRDPFGFRDGLKQPRFYEPDRNYNSKIDALSPLNTVIRDDIDLVGPGSFLVVRQYKTNVKRFRSENPGDSQQSSILGRDVEGTRHLECPHSHVSRMLGSDSGEGDSRRPRIVRRGFGYRQKSSNEEGLLFLSFQASIQDQFERLLSWANQTEVHEFPHNKVKCDELIGQNTEFNIKPKYVTLLGGEYFFAPPIARFRQ